MEPLESRMARSTSATRVGRGIGLLGRRPSSTRYVAVTGAHGRGDRRRNALKLPALSAVRADARLVRASVLSARENLCVEAGRAIGGRDRLILVRYILPNVVARRS